jgi:hypothetical protein
MGAAGIDPAHSAICIRTRPVDRNHLLNPANRFDRLQAIPLHGEWEVLHQ